jgi:hypothetical protein
LRAHHAATDIAACVGCHSADTTPVGEDVDPAYYVTLGIDPCSDAQLGVFGLDNDGDDLYDGDDPDCGPPPECVVDADCDDGQFCNGAETCDTDTGTCLPGTPVDCDDGVGCTVRQRLQRSGDLRPS